MKYTIDADGKKLGRVASEAAHVLLGKNSACFSKNKVARVEVAVVNISKLEMPERKRTGKRYARYSGYPGGLRFETLGALVLRRGHGEALRRAVAGMLPHNRLRTARMRRLTIVD